MIIDLNDAGPQILPGAPLPRTIDFNDAAPQILPDAPRKAQTPKYDLDAIRAQLAADTSWFPRLFPNARILHGGREARMANTEGDKPNKNGSCVFNFSGPHAGHATDFGRDNKRIGPIDLIGIATGLRPPELYAEAARIARMSNATVGPKKNGAHSPDANSKKLNVDLILSGCEPLAGNIVDNYFASRGLAVPQCEDLKFHADLSDYKSKRGWPAIVATVRNGAGQPTGGIHQTFLADDGSARARAPTDRRMDGPVKGGSVRLAPISMDGHIGIAEGIETALSAAVIFDVPCWAGLSAGGVATWEWPAETRRVTVFADAGKAGAEAAGKLADRLRAAGVPVEIRQPLHGDDFNDDLRKGAVVADYPTGAAVDPVRLPMAFPELMDAARGLATATDDNALGSLLGAIVLARLEPVPERQVLDAIKATKKISIKVLESQLVALKRRLAGSGEFRRAGSGSTWAGQLRRDMVGTPERNEANVIIALSNDPAFAGAIVFDEFRQEVMIQRPLPWNENAALPRSWTDTDDVRCAEWLQLREINVNVGIVGRSIGAVAHDIVIHPVRDYLQSLEWDGVARLENWVMHYLGADDTPLNRSFGALWMISAVARIMRPGSKVDHMLILEGPQGLKKSAALEIIAGDWFTNELAEIGSKDAAQQMRGVWIVEIAELDALGRADVSRIKAFLTRTVDRYRPPYGRYVISVPRQCVFAGSVNPDTYLRDETGNRRFWPVRCSKIDLESLERDRDRLWAEAVSLFDAGAVWWLTDPEMISAAKVEQETRRNRHPWQDLIEDALGDLSGKISAEAVWKIVDRPKGQRSQSDNAILGGIMRELGWERRGVWIGQQKKNGYVRGVYPYSEIEIMKENDGCVATLKGFSFDEDAI